MNYREEVTKSLTNALVNDEKALILGEGVADPKGIFGTTLEAAQRFPDRVWETPLSETMLTGACLGLALEGWKPIYVHARCDFLMLTMEHLINNIAKWRSIHHDRSFSLVMRCLVGRGWGQGPNHSQALHATFAHFPGLRVLYPVHPERVGPFLDDAMSCGQPAVILEPRRMYEVDKLVYPMWDQPDVYLITFGDVVLDAANVAISLQEAGVKAQVFPIEDIGAMSLPPHDAPTVVADTGHLFLGAAAEVVAQLAERGNTKVKRVGPPFMALPTTESLEKLWYPSADQLNQAVCDLLDIQYSLSGAVGAGNDKFTGPF